MNLVGIRKLCTPAYVYLVISMIAVLVMWIQNYYNVDVYCLGEYSCKISTYLVFIIKIVYIIFWTWILNLVCESGATYIAWFLVLFPYILFFILLSTLLITN